MIAAVVAAQPGSDGLPFNWFDVAVLLILIFGLYRGRRNGMSKEILPLLQWVVLMLVCGFLYPFAGQFYVNVFHWSRLTSYVGGYVTLGIVILLVFGVFRKLFAERVAKGEMFKSGEFYLGTLSGLIRTACIIIVILALINAPSYSQREIQQHAIYIKNTYGGGLYGGNYFPDFQQIQGQIFKESFIGPVIKKNIGLLLINHTAPPPPPAKPKPKPVIKLGK